MQLVACLDYYHRVANKESDYEPPVRRRLIALTESVEWGGVLRCTTSDGRVVNMAEELNSLERDDH